ncbi:MAG: glycosyltransferase family 2 protein [Cyclonatronaceae bacterium]
MKEPEISIIILTWNAQHHLERFLPSVEKFTPDYAEIIIADNASTDGTAGFIRERFPRFRHLLLDQNYGYCRGNNLAAEQATGKYILILNNDVAVSEGWLDPIMKILRKDPQIAVVQPKLRSVDRPDHFEYGGAAGGMLDIFGYPFCRGRLFDYVEKDTGQYDDPADIFWASGAAFAVDRNLFLEYGGFEEEFEFHMEEIDLCWRYLNSGYNIKYCPESTVYHLGGGSLPTGSYRKVYFNYRNNLAMMYRNMTTKSLFVRFPVRLLLDYVSAMRSLLLGETLVFKAILHAHGSFLKWLPRLKRQRKSLMMKRTVKTEPAIIWKESVVWRYFVNGRKDLQNSPPDITD